MPQAKPLRKILPYIFVTVLTFTAFAVLLHFRHIDDNRLTSWKWTFAGIDPVQFSALLLLAIAVVYFLLRLRIAESRPSVFLFIISFTASSFFWKEPEVIVDASRYFIQAKHLQLYGIKYFILEWGKDINAWTDLPLIPFLHGIIFRIFGENRLNIQLFTSTLFSFTVVLTYLTGKILWDRHTGFFAGVLLLGIPYIFSQVPLMLVDIPTMFFLMLSIFTFIKALERGSLWIAAHSVAVFCAFYSKYSTWLMLSILGVIAVVYFFKEKGMDRAAILKRISYIVIISASLIATVMFFKFDVISSQIKLLNEFQMPGLKRWGESFASTFLYQLHPFITAFSLYSFYIAFKKKDIKFIIAAWLILLVVLLQIKRSRYIIVTFPMIALAASYGLQCIREHDLKKYVVSCIAGASLAVAVFAYLPFLQSVSMVNMKNAGGYLNMLEYEEIEVFTLQSEESAVNQAVTVPLLDIYTHKNILYNPDISPTLSSEKIATSSLRFTWEYSNPFFYEKGSSTGIYKPVIAIISNGRINKLPDKIADRILNYEKAAVFDRSTGLFKYSPAVTVFLPE